MTKVKLEYICLDSYKPIGSLRKSKVFNTITDKATSLAYYSSILEISKAIQRMIYYEMRWHKRNGFELWLPIE